MLLQCDLPFVQETVKGRNIRIKQKRKGGVSDGERNGAG